MSSTVAISLAVAAFGVIGYLLRLGWKELGEIEKLRR